MTEPEAQRKLSQMILDLVSSVRRAKRSHPMLARAAADWEMELEHRLNPPLQLVAENDEPAVQPPPATGTAQ